MKKIYNYDPADMVLNTQSDIAFMLIRNAELRRYRIVLAGQYGRFCPSEIKMKKRNEKINKILKEI